MRVRYIVSLLTLGALAYLLFWPTGLTFESFEVPEAPLAEGVLLQNTLLDSVRELATAGDGPEDVAIAADGSLYTGTADGHVLVLEPGAKDWRPITVTYGRPLGLAFDPTGRWLYVADGERGLMKTDREGHLERLVDTFDGEDLGLVDDLTVADDGTVYLTSATRDWGLDGTYGATLEHHGTGRVFRYRPRTKRLELLLDTLDFPNGLAVTPSGDALLIAETLTYRVLRYQLTGPDSGEVSVFADNLPGFPDGLNYDERGQLWVSLPYPREGLLDALGPYPFWREVIYRTPSQFQPQGERKGYVLALDAEGRVVETLQGERFAGVTNAVWRGDTVYLGSLEERSLGRWVR